MLVQSITFPLRTDINAEAPPSKKRKLEEGAASSAKKTKTDEDDEDEENGDVEDDADEQEQEEDEPAVKTKVIKGSETKQEAATAKDEAYEEEEA